MPDEKGYSPKLFVNRQELLKNGEIIEKDPVSLILESARDLTRGKIPKERTIIFMGERGIGKSWLLKHIETILHEEWPELKPVLLDLDQYQYSSGDPKAALLNVFSNVWGQLFDQPEQTSGLTPVDLSGELIRKIPSIFADYKGLVLLVDSAYESSWDLLADLENYLLGPLSSEPQVLTVITGRGRPYPWKTPELRLDAQFKQLDKFTEEETTEQLKKRGIPEPQHLCHKIYPYTQGNPLANSLLAADPDISPKTLEAAINGILETVPENERPEVRKNLEAISVLREFDEERIGPVLTAYNDEGRSPGYRETQKIRQQVVKYGFAHWKKEKGGYVLDETIHNLLEKYLKQPQNLKKLQNLHQAALDLYQNWSKEYPRTKDQWEAEAAYHRQELDSLVKQPNQ